MTSFDYSEEKVIVETINSKTHEADRVSVSVSLGILKSEMIRFKPEMSTAKKEAIESTTFHPDFKVAMKFSEKFYPDAITCKVETGEKGFYDIAFKKNTQDNILGFLRTSHETQKYYSLNSEQEIISNLLQELYEMFDGKATVSYSGNYILENWEQHEFTQGTWRQAFQENKSPLKILKQSLDNKVYFAREIHNSYQGEEFK